MFRFFLWWMYFGVHEINFELGNVSHKVIFECSLWKTQLQWTWDCAAKGNWAMADGGFSLLLSFFPQKEWNASSLE